MKKFAVLIAVILVIAGCDMALTYNSVIPDSRYFEKNDFEITKEKHTETVWDKVIFGNSVVSGAYIEDWGSGYINLGLKGVEMTDLKKMLDTRHVKIGTELVIGLDYKMFCGGENTEYEYIWNKKLYEPYVYFERERIIPVIKDFIEKNVTQKPQQTKEVKRGVAHDRDMLSSAVEYEMLTTDRLEENISAFEAVIAYCNEKGIRVRAVWMPKNPMFDRAEVLDDVRARVDAVLSLNGIGVYDMENIFAIGDFYDVSYLNYDIGSPKFTALLYSWL